MPHQVWRLNCCCDSPDEMSTTAGGDVPMGLPMGRSCSGPEACPDCGEPSLFDGWARGAIEQMAQYQRIHGLKALGPHRQLASLLFDGLRESCAGCRGSGLVGREKWAYCAVCEGTGGFWVADEAYLVWAYRALLYRYPDVAAPGGLSEGGLPVE